MYVKKPLNVVKQILKHSWSVSHTEKVKNHDLDNMSDNRSTNFKAGVKRAEIKLSTFFLSIIFRLQVDYKTF